MREILVLRDEHSLRSDFTLKLNMAKAFSLVDKFYFPHNMDFRGRVYPVPPHLNHMGNDLSRGLLLFSEGRKLGKSGLKWLKIHCANLMGKDKGTIDEKLQFVVANMGLIKAIAEGPLQNREWISFEDCWQALAAILELNDALK
jgi:DNA-directed RNA polymerase